MPKAPTTDFDLDDFLPYQLAVLSERISREFSAIYRSRYGLSRADWRVLAHLSQARTVSVRDIHLRADLEKSKVSRAATRLEAAGYITKTGNPEDRRLVSLALTDAGRALMAEMVPLARDYQARALARLGDEAEHFRRLLRQLSQDTPEATQD
jgi:DNA-binding MarR family transcriptional regulator